MDTHTTDWNLVRRLMGAVIDACERIEASGFREADRGATVDIGAAKVSVQDILTSIWTYAETLRYAIVRTRHDEGRDLPYVPETARILLTAAGAAAELPGAGWNPPGAREVEAFIAWLDGHALPNLERAIDEGRPASAP
jgi:hypothetical protein